MTAHWKKKKLCTSLLVYSPLVKLRHLDLRFLCSVQRTTLLTKRIKHFLHKKLTRLKALSIDLWHIYSHFHGQKKIFVALHILYSLFIIISYPQHNQPLPLFPNILIFPSQCPSQLQHGVLHVFWLCSPSLSTWTVNCRASCVSVYTLPIMTNNIFLRFENFNCDMKIS